MNNNHFADNEENKKICDSYGSLFLLLDGVFSDLNVSRHDFEESLIPKLESRLNVLLKEWIRMGLNLTPKLYILVDHAIIQLIALKVSFDMREDQIEHSHQDHMKNESRLIRLRNKQSKMNSQAKQQERVNLESITQIQHDVAARTKRNITQNIT